MNDSKEQHHQLPSQDDCSSLPAAGKQVFGTVTAKCKRRLRSADRWPGWSAWLPGVVKDVQISGTYCSNNRGANNIKFDMLSINRGQPSEGGGFGGFVANMLINI